MKHTPLAILSLLLPLPIGSCSHGDLIFATRTSLGVEVAGDQKAVIPDHVNIGYRRRELIAVGDHAPKDGNLLAKVDIESHFAKGLAIQETYATGRAALDIASGGKYEDSKSEEKPKTDQPLVFGSRTRFGLSLSMPSSEDQTAPSLVAGYSRRTATIIRSETGNSRLPSVAAAVSVSSNGLSDGAGPQGGLKDANRLSPDSKWGSVRITQLFATGSAAENLSRERTTELAEALQSNAVSSPAEAAAAANQ